MPEYMASLIDPASRTDRAANFVLLGLAVAAQLVGAAVLWWAADHTFASEMLIAAAAATCVLAGLEIRRLARSTSGLAHQLHLHRRIFDTSLDLIFVTDRQGRFTDVSPSSLPLLGYRPDEMIGRNAADFIHRDDLEPTRNELRLGRRGQQQRNFATRYQHKDGHTVTLGWTGVWSEPEQRHFFIGRDLTEEHRLMAAERTAKEALGAVIDASPVAIVCLAADRTVTVWSRAAEQIFGYKAEEVIGKPYMLVPVEEGAQGEYADLFARALGNASWHMRQTTAQGWKADRHQL